MMTCLLLLLAGMRSATGTLRKYNISGTIYFTTENEVDKVMPNMQIHLMEKDGLFNAPDDLGQAVTDEHGHFEGLVGEEDEKEEPEPYLSIPVPHCNGILTVCEGFQLPRLKTPFWSHCGTFTSHKIKEGRVTNVWLPSTPERQNVSIYLGYKIVAYLHREGQEDLTLYIRKCS
jgi:hypothetical protein